MQISYKDAAKWIDSLAHRMSGFGLENTLRLCKLSGTDISKFRVLHVAGSNGKGSTCAFSESILRSAGYKTGFYSSPHLLEYTERIKVAGKNISRKKFAALASVFRKIAEKNRIDASSFEILTAMAMRYFADSKIDILIAEVGLGGRLDSTNVLHGNACVITSISLEHTQYLGDTIEKIAAEKAGIIKQNSVAVFSQNNTGIKTIQEKVHEAGAQEIIIEFVIKKSDSAGNEFDLIAPQKISGLKTSLLGPHQCENAALAAAAAIALRKSGFEISDKNIKDGIFMAKWRGRMEVICKKPLVLLDGAHNEDGWKILLENIGMFKRNKLIAVFGAMKDKDFSAAKNLLERPDVLFIAKAQSERAAEPEIIKEAVGRGEIVPSVEKAITRALKIAKKDDMILVSGSIYVIGEAIRALNKFR